MSTAEKIRAAEAAARWRQRHPGPVVFTNGVFDLLHVGHVALLEAARAEGAALIVGVNSDASVRRLSKGSRGDRPVVPERERARLLAALASVDCVVVFDEDSPLVLIERLRPDVLVLRKGGNLLLHNDGGGRFSNATDAARLPAYPSLPALTLP